MLARTAPFGRGRCVVSALLSAALVHAAGAGSVVVAAAEGLNNGISADGQQRHPGGGVTMAEWSRWNARLQEVSTTTSPAAVDAEETTAAVAAAEETTAATAEKTTAAAEKTTAAAAEKTTAAAEKTTAATEKTTAAATEKTTAPATEKTTAAATEKTTAAAAEKTTAAPLPSSSNECPPSLSLKGDCKEVDGVDGISVCFGMSDGDADDTGAGSCNMWVREGDGGGDDDGAGGRDLCCQLCSVCEDGKGFSYDCNNIVAGFNATCSSKLDVPKNFVLIDTAEGGAASKNATTATTAAGSATTASPPSATNLDLGDEKFVGPVRTDDIVAVLHGLNTFDNQARSIFQSEYATFVERFYLVQGAEVQVSATVTGIDTNIWDRRRLAARFPAVAVRYNQVTTYRGLPLGTDNKALVLDPFDGCQDAGAGGAVIALSADGGGAEEACGGRNAFAKALRTAHSTFSGLTTMEGPEIERTFSDSTSAGDAAASGDGGGIGGGSSINSTAIIIVIVIVTVLVEVVLMGLAYYLYQKRKERKKKKALEGREIKTMEMEKDEDDGQSLNEESKTPYRGRFDDENASLGPSIVDNYVTDGDDGTLSYYDPGPQRRRSNQGASIVSEADDQTAEYDYRRAFLSGPYNGQSVVSGATREEQSTWSDAQTKEESMATLSVSGRGRGGGDESATQYTDDERTRSVMPYLLPYKGMSQGKSWRDAQEYYKHGQRIIVDAPPGKLGLVIDNPEGWAPVVHTVGPASVLRDRLRVGDRLLSLDGDDLTGMTAVEVSKMIARRCNNRIRRFKIVRAPGAYEEV